MWKGALYWNLHCYSILSSCFNGAIHEVTKLLIEAWHIQTASSQFPTQFLSQSAIILLRLEGYRHIINTTSLKNTR